jgi:ribosome-associated translation inhibitor RaiA
MQKLIDNLKRRLARLKEKEQALTERHDEVGTVFLSYHGGWDLGYIQGKIAEIEDFIDDLEELDRNAKL